MDLFSTSTMAMSTPPAPGPNSGDTEGHLFGYVREIRVEAQNIQKALTEVKAKTELDSKSARGKETEAVLEENDYVFKSSSGQITEYFTQLRKFTKSDANLHNRYGDELARMENAWERAFNGIQHLLSLKPPFSDDEVAEVSRQLKKLETPLRDMVYSAGLITIPRRLNEHLETLRVGQYLDFHANFVDELEPLEDRVKLLRYIRDHPGSVWGVVNVTKGLVFFTSPDPWRRRLSFLLIALALLSGGAITLLFSQAGSWLKLDQWPVGPSQYPELMVGYLFVLLGGLVHVAIDGVKQARSGVGESSLAVEDWLLWIHTHESAIAMSIVYLVMGLLGLFLLTHAGDQAGKPAAKIDWQTAFFVGYSIDSFVDLFLQRFTTTASGRVQALRQQLS